MEPANNMSGPDTGSGPDRLQQIRERFDRADEHADKLRGNSLNSEALISDHHSDSRGDSGLDVYQDITSSLRDQSLQRHENRISKIEQLQDSIKFRLIGRVAVVAALLLLTAIIYHAVTTRQATEVPQSLAIWMEQQKLLRQVAQVQQWLASGQAQSDLPPPESVEDLQSWLDQIRLSPDLQKLETETGSEPGFVAFQCPVAPIQCLAEDIPNAPGQQRIELNHLVRNANTMQVENGNCEGTADLIGEYANLFGWRRSEAITKSLVEISVARCFMDADDTDNAAVHYTRAYCASVSNPDPHEAMTALYGLARISWLADDTQQVSHYTQCSEDLLDYHLRQEPDVNTLSNFITLALLLYELTGDSGESIRVKEKGLAAARELMPDVQEHELEVVREVMLILQMNLMEVYLTLNETEPLNQLYDELKGNPMLEEGDRLVALGLLAMQDLIDNNHASAREHLRRITTRYQALAEFTTMWSWEAIDRWHEETESTRSAIVNEQIKDIRLALSNERPADSMQRLYRVLAATGGR
jgi:hypothetical protein